MSVRDAVVVARQQARATGIARLEAELDSAAVEAHRTNLALAEFSQDWQRGQRFGRSYADRWLREAEAGQSSTAASVATDGSLRRIAVTESSEAFSSGRSRQITSISTNVQVMRVWDAMLDACPICWSEDGHIVGVRESFPAGEPGTVHPFCRCQWSLITIQERPNE